ncbi:MAG: rod-binding protein [Leptospira sp.]|nr:rod-binding protein [Leptospira sp.]
MSDIFKIQDYSNRMNITEQNLKKMENIQNRNENKNVTSFDDYLMQEVSPSIQGKVSSAEITVSRDIKSEIAQDPYRKKLYDASVEFESMFVKLMLKEMKNSVSKNKMIHGGYAEEIFEDMLTDEQSKEISKNDSIGIAEQVYSTLSKSLPPLKA